MAVEGGPPSLLVTKPFLPTVLVLFIVHPHTQQVLSYNLLFLCIDWLAIPIKSDSRQTNINTCSCQNLTSRIILIYLKEHCLNTGYCLMTQIFTLDYRDVSHIIIKAGGGSDTFWNQTKSQRNSTK